MPFSTTIIINDEDVEIEVTYDHESGEPGNHECAPSYDEYIITSVVCEGRDILPELDKKQISVLEDECVEDWDRGW